MAATKRTATTICTIASGVMLYLYFTPPKEREDYGSSSHYKPGSQVTFIKGIPAKEHYRKYKIRLVHNKSRGITKRSAGMPRYNTRRSQAVGSDPNDFAMMEELLSRRLMHKEWAYPQVIVIDGGKGQLSSAKKAIINLISMNNPQLSKTALGNIKLVALAKKQSELFFPGKPKSVLLRDLPRSSENLFLYIRDEAHRFAISYHRHLRSKSVREN